MSHRQLEACAIRIKDPAKRAEFRAMFDEARAMFLAAADLRRNAWKLYYSATGTRSRAEQELFR